MLFGSPSLRLTPLWQQDGAIALIPPTEAIRLRRDEGYEDVPVREALWEFDGMERRPSWELRDFVAKAALSRVYLHETDDQQLLHMIRQAIRDGRLIALRKGDGTGKTTSETVERRRLVRQIEQHTRGKLNASGRQYKLVADVDLARTPGRDNYEVASQSEARAVLDGMAKQLGAPAELLKQASEKLSKDWCAPRHPEGLVLLRRIVVQASAPKDDGPAITPSQMKALLTKEKPDDFVLELEHLYHDDQPVHEAPFTVELSDGSTVKGQLDAEGRATVHLAVMPARVQFGPDSRPWRKVDQTANPDFQDKLDIDAFIDSHLESST